MCVWGGPIGSNGTCSTLCQFSVTPSATHIQIGPLWCCFLSGWVCACSRPLLVSAMNSPVRLGVSLAAASTPTGVFSEWFEALFPQAGTLGFEVCYLVHQLASCSLAASPLRPAARLHLVAPPTSLDECFFLISLVVRLPYSSIFCQLWLFFVFKLLLSFFWL